MAPETLTCRAVEPLPDEIKSAKLESIDLYKLKSGSLSEQEALFRAAVNDGFFYLDLTHPSFQSYLDNVDQVFQLSAAIFDQDGMVKDLFDVDRISRLKTNGYKPKGRNIVSKDGGRDGFESWVMPRNGILGLGNDPFPHTPAIADEIVTLKTLVQDLTSAAQIIFKSLSRALSLDPTYGFEAYHRQEQPSPDILRLLKYHADDRTNYIPQTPHTDLGSLTFVFSTTPGLQVLPFDSAPNDRQSDWAYVPPRAGHAIVNIGDCLTMMTNGLLKSALHRVGPLPQRAMGERYSFAYLMRPEDSTPLRPVNSPLVNQTRDNEQVITSGEWITKKFKALRAGSGGKQNDNLVLTGGRGITV